MHTFLPCSWIENITLRIAREGLDLREDKLEEDYSSVAVILLNNLYTCIRTDAGVGARWLTPGTSFFFFENFEGQ